MIKIKMGNIPDQVVHVPGSKSYTHRLLIAAALSDGTSVIENCLKSEDTLLTLAALKQMGVNIKEDDGRIIVKGRGGSFKPCKEPVYLANSGTSMRLLTGVAALGDGKYLLTGSERMSQRPIRDLLDALNQIGVAAVSVNNNGCPPVEITGGMVDGGSLAINCSLSSQYLSSLMLIAPCTKNGLTIEVVELVSRPYVDMTIDIMKKFGIKIVRNGYEEFVVPGGQQYIAGAYAVEPDFSQAGYFWAAAAITGAKIKVKGTTKDSRQGDVKLARVLQSMGCSIFYEDDGIAVKGGELSAIEVDMSDMPDTVPTLAVVAAFAKGTTVITNVAHLKEKESDRLGSVARELNKMGIKATAFDSGLTIKGGKPLGAKIDTYNDHRIAMCFAIAGLKVPGVVIKDEKCVEKSFPNFWEVFERLYQR